MCVQCGMYNILHKVCLQRRFGFGSVSLQFVVLLVDYVGQFRFYFLRVNFTMFYGEEMA